MVIFVINVSTQYGNLILVNRDNTWVNPIQTVLLLFGSNQFPCWLATFRNEIVNADSLYRFFEGAFKALKAVT